MTPEQIKAWLDAMPPEERERVLQSLFASYEERGDQLDVEQGYADRLRDTSMPGMIDAGRYKVAASPLDFAGSLAQRGVGQYQSNRVAEQREEMASNKEQALQALVQKMLGGGAAPVPMPPGPTGMSPASTNVPALIAGLRR